MTYRDYDAGMHTTSLRSPWNRLPSPRGISRSGLKARRKTPISSSDDDTSLRVGAYMLGLLVALVASYVLSLISG